MQLLVCYAFVLIFDDVVRPIWVGIQVDGNARRVQVPPLFIAGGVVPPYYLLLIGVALAVAAISALVCLQQNRQGDPAAAHNPGMVSALGINTGLTHGGASALGGGCWRAPPARRSTGALVNGMGFSVPIESFIVTGTRRHGLDPPH
jgi:branched-chain amino acid transport system permease protein